MASSSEHTGADLAAELRAEAHRRSLEDFLLSEPLVVGVSGGADSLALLHLLVGLRGELAPATLHVAHLNHWFRGNEAQEDAEFVRNIAGSWGLSCTVETFDVPNYARRRKLSPEDAARRARYAFLGALAHERGAAVAVAHNADDQVETVLMSILRGTGTGGLAGMRMLSNVPMPPPDETIAAFDLVPERTSVPLFRPLLNVWRHQVLAYCKQAGLEPRFDSTNWERTYRRNRIRHDLIPLLQMQYSLAIKEHLFNLAQIAQAEDDLVEAEVDGQWGRTAIIASEEGQTVRFQSNRFAALAEALKRRLARRAVATVAGTLHDYTFAHIETAVAIIAGESGAPKAQHLPHGIVVSREEGWGVVRLRADAGVSITVPGIDFGAWPLWEPRAEVRLYEGCEIALDCGWRFRAKITEPGEAAKAGELLANFDADALASLGPIVLRSRRPGDTIVPLGMEGHKSLQDLLVDARIPRELRDRIPIAAFEGGHEVLWVPGRGGRRSCNAPLTETTRRVLQLRFWLDSIED